MTHPIDEQRPSLVGLRDITQRLLCFVIRVFLCNMSRQSPWLRTNSSDIQCLFSRFRMHKDWMESKSRSVALTIYILSAPDVLHACRCTGWCNYLLQRTAHEWMGQPEPCLIPQCAKSFQSNQTTHCLFIGLFKNYLIVAICGTTVQNTITFISPFPSSTIPCWAAIASDLCKDDASKGTFLILAILLGT